jgi:PHD/YefM family antitoxin component YafN of YafNO toxin-antitoxin module
MQQLATVQRTKIGKESVVVLPIKKWEEVENSLEDLEMYTSEKLRKGIKKSRAEVKRGEVFGVEEVGKML